MLFALGSAVPSGAQSARALFDGKTLKGWTILGNGAWTVADGAIHAKLSRQDPQFTHLVHDSTFGDFTLEFRFRHVKGNAGFFFRMEQKDATPAGVTGLQMVIEPTLPLPDAFGFYETNGRGWVQKWDYAAKKSLYKPGEWNVLRLEAKGMAVKAALNGSELVSLPDDRQGRLKGKLAFKLHGGQDVEIAFRDIVLLEAGGPSSVRSAPSRRVAPLFWTRNLLGRLP